MSAYGPRAVAKSHEAHDFLSRVFEEIKEVEREIDDPTEKESHEGKKLAAHVEECWDFAKELLDTLGFEDEYKRFCLVLCVTHDLGKLDKRWRLGPDKLLTRHSERSLELLQKCWSKFPHVISHALQPALFFAILRHHTSLRILNLREDLRQELKGFEKLDPNTLVKVSDVVGIFKLADIISATGDFKGGRTVVLQQYKPLGVLEMKIVEELRKKVKEKAKGQLDEERYGKQRSIASARAKHLALAAPTGWGKTAVALLRAVSAKPRKIFYCLPTITAIKEFKGALESTFGSDFVGDYFYFSDVEFFKRSEEGESTYPFDFYRYFVPKVVITTVDQLLMASIQVGQYHLRRFNMKDCLLVFDEFHLLTPEMIGVLKAVFDRLLSAYNLSVLFMSASPTELYLSSVRDLLSQRGGFQVEFLEEEYGKLRRHRIQVSERQLEDFVKDEADLMKGAVKSGRKVLVIANTPEKAMRVYEILRSDCKIEEELNLIHARFAYKDRDAKEEKIDSASVVVSTQVAEASLDKSFDLLITDIAPIPSIIQRLGRVNRYGERQVSDYNAYVCLSKDHQPYKPSEIVVAKDLLSTYLGELNSKGEGILFRILSEFEDWTKEDFEGAIEKSYEFTIKSLEEHCRYFYSLSIKEEEVQRFLGREPDYLAIPPLYREQVQEIRRRLKEATYEGRRRLWSKVKEHFVPTPHYVKVVPDDELGLLVISDGRYTYDQDLGLMRRTERGRL